MVMPMRTERLQGLGAAALLLAAAGLAWYGQPDPYQKWQFLAPELGQRLTERQVQIEPAELLGLMHDDYIDLHLIDVRDERDWNMFHLSGAQRIRPAELVKRRERLVGLPSNGVVVFVGNDEAAATKAWKLAMAIASRPNAYVLAGGLNRWLSEFADIPRGDDKVAEVVSGETDDTLRYPLKWALGSRHPASLPDPHQLEGHHVVTKKVKLQQRVVKKGGCG
jgi:rhodanese-related sulfurtransferase